MDFVSFLVTEAKETFQVIVHDVIDIDKDGDSADVMFIDEKFDPSNKGKAILDVSDDYGDHQTQVCN